MYEYLSTKEIFYEIESLMKSKKFEFLFVHVASKVSSKYCFILLKSFWAEKIGEISHAFSILHTGKCIVPLTCIHVITNCSSF